MTIVPSKTSSQRSDFIHSKSEPLACHKTESLPSFSFIIPAGQ